MMRTAPLRRAGAIGVAAAIFLCIPVEAASELENHDAAFSLLIEAFGEVQGGFIENDYQTRVQATRSMADPVSRRHAVELAKEERDLRLGKLKRQLTEMAVAYQYSRHTGEGDSGLGQRERIDPATAARSLSRFILIGATTNTSESVVAIRRPQ